MPEVTAPYPPGTPCWVDVSASDQQAALDFYRDVFAWSGEVGPPEHGGYATCELHGRPVAGVMAAQATPEQPVPCCAWTTYFCTADADATARAVTTNGGTVLLPPQDVTSLGRMAVAADPAGAVFGLWQPRDFAGAGVVNEPGTLIWNELLTRAPDDARAFYPATLGLDIAPMAGATDYDALQVRGRTVGGIRPLDDTGPQATSYWLPYFAVEDTDGAVDAVISGGGAVTRPPFDMQAGRMAVVRDPQGAVFAVIAPTPMMAS